MSQREPDSDRSARTRLAIHPLVEARGRALHARWPGLMLAAAVHGEDGSSSSLLWDASGIDGVAAIDAHYLIYSVTKPVIAALVLQLAAAGRIDLDAALARWLPAAPHAAEVTPRQLLAHTSGMRDYGPLPAYHAAVRTSPGLPWTYDEFAARAEFDELRFAPGTGWSYSNIGYMLLRELVEHMRDQSFRTIVEQEIALPLGIDVGVATAQADLQALVPGYSTYLAVPGATDARIVDVREVYHPGWVAHGVMTGTAPALAALIHWVCAAEFLPRTLGEALRTPRPIPGIERRGVVAPAYGLGLMMDAGAQRGVRMGHTGEGPGYSAAAYHMRRGTEAGPTVAVLANVEAADDVEALAHELLDAAIDAR